jgi:hypothetical protein
VIFESQFERQFGSEGRAVFSPAIPGVLFCASEMHAHAVSVLKLRIAAKALLA